jgi:hypothetical protein
MGGTSFGAPYGGLGAGPIRAYHGSPYDFERFDINRIGTGEGAQAYGHGLYFAENPAVAESYKRALTGLNPNQLGSGKGQFGVGNNPIPQGISGHAALDTGQEMDLLLGTMKTNPESNMIPYLKQKIENRIANHYSMTAEGTAGDDMRAMAKYYNDYVKNADPKDVTSIAPGKMYEVNIRADPEQFLNWDVPLYQQSVAGAVRNIVPGDLRLAFDKNVASGITGANAYMNYIPTQSFAIKPPFSQTFVGSPAKTFEEALASVGGDTSRVRTIFNPSREGTSEALREAGIPGIRYLDQGSRGNAPAYARELEGQRLQVAKTAEALKADPTNRALQQTLAHDQDLLKRLEQNPRGTSNYVLFRDDIIDILRKYGLIGGAALPYALAPSSDTHMQTDMSM